MLVSHLEVEGLFSFGVGDRALKLALTDSLSVVVGPNGSGKSSVARVLNLLQAAVRYDSIGDQQERQMLWNLLQGHALNARHRGMSDATRSSVRLSVALTSGPERDLLTAYIRSAVFCALVGRNSGAQDFSPYESWVDREVTANKLVSLHRGTLTISHSGIPGTEWEVAYHFQHGSCCYVWHLDTAYPNVQNAISPAGAIPEMSHVHTLSLRLIGQEVPPTPLPAIDPSVHFKLEMLLPAEDEVVRFGIEGVNSKYPPRPLRDFVTAAGFVPSPSDPNQVYGRSYGAGLVFSRILDQGIALFGTHGSYRDPQGATVGFGMYPASLLAQPLTRRDGQLLPARLYQLKNGDGSAKRRYEQLRDLFRQLAPGRDFELTSQHRVQAGDSSVQVDIQVEVFAFPPLPDDFATPVELAGTGVEQALALAEAIVGGNDRLLVLDEPAVNLHPEWQRLVRARLASGPGQFLLVTHSPYLVPTDTATELSSICRFQIESGATAPRFLRHEDLDDHRWLAALVKELSWSADASSLFFSSGVVLVEGRTELAALPMWFTKSPTALRHRPPGDLQIGFYSVDGDQNFGTLIRYLDRFGVPWVVVCDGAAFRFDASNHIFEQVVSATGDPVMSELSNRLGVTTRQQDEMTQDVFDDLCRAGRQGGVFTLAPGWQRKSEPAGDQESFEAFLRSKSEFASILGQGHAEAGRSKARQGRIIANAMECPTEVNDLYAAILERLWATGMLRLPELRWEASTRSEASM